MYCFYLFLSSPVGSVSFSALFKKKKKKRWAVNDCDVTFGRETWSRDEVRE